MNFSVKCFKDLAQQIYATLGDKAMAGFSQGKRPASTIVIQLAARSRRAQAGFLLAGPFKLRCAIGRSGVRTNKREGDGATPAGRFRLLRVYYRPDRISRPRTAIPLEQIKPRDGWCDASVDRNYNRPVRLPYPASHERLWRNDGLYDVIVVLDYNIAPRRRMRGSAIFMHVARAGYKPTQGCIALDRADILKLIMVCGQGGEIRV
jgi:L,D-peptidoglycan transpeptidase YkuD (ErfK/YbiS/YcfS/YnhG family)